MSEKGVRVVFSPESLRHRAAGHSNVATNERTSNVRPARKQARVTSSVRPGVATNLQTRMPEERQLARVAATFALLSDAQRIKIVLALTTADELCVGDVASALGVSVSVASHHLRKLRDCGVLHHRAEGKQVYYFFRARYVARLVVTALRATGA